MRRQAAVAALLAALGSLPAGSTQAEDRIPAQIGRAKDSLVSRVACPAADPDEDLRIKVFCRAAVGPDGRVKSNESYCFSTDDNALAYVRAASAASEGARFIPASVAGEPVQVLVNYQFLFRLVAGACRVAAIPNHGANAASFGLAYYAPAPIDERDAGLWRRRLFRPAGSGQSLVSAKGVAFVIGAEISAEGKVGKVRVLDNNFGSRQDIRRAMTAIRRSSFIPGHVGGKPTAMRYVYYLYYDPDEQSDPAPARSCC